ncbi:sensor histidine kinase [Nocardia macrotermitis]|uniref:histidine kinase n=1 Tax=Nocardia macrotermitis TaxID=2585198 RepID=A0A7K0D3T9_9NOCA|nr:HAMP domain-containing sensor histidine kinase [Nocardia macrotermitis]MQY20281.1 putative sensor histidine kinase TcrY [Nocardia macrotermitis]
MSSSLLPEPPVAGAAAVPLRRHYSGHDAHESARDTADSGTSRRHSRAGSVRESAGESDSYRRSGRWSPRRWSLRLRLLVGQVLLLVLVVVGIGAATELALQQFLVHQLDTQLMDTEKHALMDSGGGSLVGPLPADWSAHPPPRLPDATTSGAGPTFLNRGGIQPDSIGAMVADGKVTAAGKIGSDGSQVALSDTAKSQLASLTTDGRPVTIDLDGVGSYRVVASQTYKHVTIVTGLPMDSVNATLMRGLLVSVIVTIVALAVAITVGVWVIRRALAPLDRVASTAARVARLPLDRGEVELPVRVPAADSDPGTEVGKLGAAVNRMLEHIAGALSARHDSEIRVRQFVADASHELRTPLAAIRGYTELAQRNRDEVPPIVAEAMGRVDAAAHRMSGLVEDLLLLARLDSGRPLERQPVDLTPLTVDAISDAHIAGPDHHWDLSLPDTPVMVLGDVARLHQVLANLLTNARVHTPPGTSVLATLQVDTDSAVWTVRDDGPGIPATLQPEVFQRFARGDSSRSRHAGSTGLGLAIVAAVVKAHGGEITVDSEPGRTEFKVRLPLVRPSTAESTA